MQICLLRHAKAEAGFSPNPKEDAKRVLTPEGIRKMGKVAAGMAALELKFDLILSSPYPRAKQTAEIVAEKLGITPLLELDERLVAVANPEDFLAELCSRRLLAQSLLIVGHEPFLGELASLLLTGQKNTLHFEFKKAGLLCLTVDKLQRGHCAVLNCFLSPGQLSAIK